MRLEQFRHLDGGKLVFVPCFELVATSTAPLVRGAPGFIEFYEYFLQRFGSALTTFKTGTMTSWRQPDAKALRMLPSWLSDHRNFAGKEFGIQFHSGPSVVEKVSPSLRAAFGQDGSYISMTVPPEVVSAGPAPALELTRGALGEGFALAFGWAGYAVLWNAAMGPLMDDSYRKLGAWLKRYPGLGQGDDFAIYERALRGISNVSWLTLLGAELARKKGGQQAITAALGPEISVFPLGEGVCIQAGAVPQIGDVNRGDNLPLLRRVGSFLKDLRTHEPPRFLEGLGDDTEAWFGRFDA